MQRKKSALRLVLSLALVVSMLFQSMFASAGFKTVATNGNQLINISIKVSSNKGKAVSGAEVTLKAHDFNVFAKTRNLSLTAITDEKGVATFKISSSYDRVRGYSIQAKGYVSEGRELDDFIGLTKSKRSYSVSISKIKNKVSFFDASGKEISKQTIEYGEAAKEPKVPEYNGASTYMMEFKGWDKSFDNVTEELNIHPVYEQTKKNKYYRLFVERPEGLGDAIGVTNANPLFNDIFGNASQYTENEDGFVVMSDGVKVRIEDQMTLEKTVVNINSSQKGCYSEATDDGKTLICFEAEDGTIYKTDFASIDWYSLSKARSHIYGKAAWEKYYKVNFYDATGSIFVTKQAHEGEGVEAPEAPVYNGTSNYNMKFVKWDTAFDVVTSTLDVHPVYEKTTTAQYWRLFVSKPAGLGGPIGITHNNPLFRDIFGNEDVYSENENGVIVMSDGAEVHLEDQMSLAKTVVNINKSQIGSYAETTEDGRTLICTEAEDGVVYKLDFTAIDWKSFSRSKHSIYGDGEWTKYFTVSFHDASGNVFSKQHVVEGGDAVAPEAPEYNGESTYRMEFVKWIQEFNNITKSIDVYPEYKAVEKKCTFMFYIERPDGGRNIPVCNDGMPFYDCFANRDFEEENGVITMNDGVKICIEDKVNIYNHSLNPHLIGAGMFLEEENGDFIYGYVDPKTGEGFKTALSSVDFYRFARTNKDKGNIYGKSSNWITVHAVKFYDAAGNVIDTQRIDDGTSAVAPEAPKYNGDSDYAMKFVKWDISFENVTEALNVKPVYERTQKSNYAHAYLMTKDGGHLRLGNGGFYFKDFFNKSLTETEGGLAHMSDGATYQVEEVCPGVVTWENPYFTKWVNASSILTDEGYVIRYTDKNGVTYQVPYTAINWVAIEKGYGDGPHVIGVADWEEYVEPTEDPDEDPIEEPAPEPVTEEGSQAVIDIPRPMFV